MKKTYYAHFGNRQRSCGVLTASYRELDCETLGIGLAYCSPKDQFVKAKGRMIADRRRDSRACIMTTRKDGQSILEAVAEGINGFIGADQRVPKWARNTRVVAARHIGNVLIDKRNMDLVAPVHMAAGRLAKLQEEANE